MPQQSAPQPRESFTCKSGPGHLFEVDVIGSESGRHKPCVMWIHGGGLIFGSRTISPRASFLELLVQRGFIVLSVDYRLAPETKLEGILSDIRDLWRWLHEQGPGLFGADPEHVCIAGASSGAFLALLGGYKLSPRPRAIGSFWGFGNITAPWEAEPSEHYRTFPLLSRSDALASLALTPIPTSTGEDRSAFYLYCRQQGLWLQEVTGRSLPEGLDWLREYCPACHIGADFPPTVIVHGRDDTDVPCAESELLAAKLGENKVPFEYYPMPGVGHGFAGAAPEVVQAMERAAAEFLWARAIE